MAKNAMQFFIQKLQALDFISSFHFRDYSILSISFALSFDGIQVSLPLSICYHDAAIFINFIRQKETKHILVKVHGKWVELVGATTVNR